MGDTDRNKTSFTLSIGAMAMLTVCSVFSLRKLAEYGRVWLEYYLFLVASAVCFFVPSALVSAELASTYPGRGGVFVWVREAFGPKYGFLAIFMGGFRTCLGIRQQRLLWQLAWHTPSV